MLSIKGMLKNVRMYSMVLNTVWKYLKFGVPFLLYCWAVFDDFRYMCEYMRLRSG